MNNNHSSKPTRLCTDPWKYIEIGTTGAIRPCCKYPPVSKLGKDMKSTDQILNSDQYTNLRTQLLSGDLSATCRKCHIRPMATVSDLEKHLEASRTDNSDLLTSPSKEEVEIRIDLTTRCNLRCVYCAVSSPNYVGSDMEEGTFEELIDLLKGLCASTQAVVHINGHGETTYHPDWERSAKEVIKSGHKPNMITNLAKNYTEDEFLTLADFATIQISLDSADEGLMKKIRKPVRVEKVFQNIEMIRAAADKKNIPSPKISLSVGIYDPSIWKLPDLIDVAYNHSIKDITFWNLVEYSHQKGVKSISRLEGCDQNNAHTIMREVQKKLEYYQIEHVFAGDFIDQDGNCFLQKDDGFVLDNLGEQDLYWVRKHIEDSGKTTGISNISVEKSSWDILLKEIVKLNIKISTPQTFSEDMYLDKNPDVRSAVERGEFYSGYEHFVMYGRNEGRRRTNL